MDSFDVSGLVRIYKGLAGQRMRNTANLECPVCAGDNWSRDLTAGKILGLPERYEVLLCSTCGQRRLEPQLSEVELQELYSGSYFNSKREPSDSQAEIRAPVADY